jgi:phosphoribosylformimino-5-aminoimidazole carboxamide ribotide isomerase
MPPPVTHSCTRIVGVGRRRIKPVSFRVIPVIDLKGGIAVHAVGGRRDQYQTLRSVWQASASPIALTAALRDGLGIDRLYVADLGAIEGRPPDAPLYELLDREGLQVWLDAGVRNRTALEPLMRPGLNSLQIVVGLESVEGPAELGEIIDHVDRDRMIFSLDLDEGKPRTARGAAWPSDDSLEIASQIIDLGIRRLILLDLARVGTGRGVGTESLLARIQARCGGIDIAVGGGILDIDDVLRLKEQGVAAVLVGSALHDGRIGRRELERITSQTAEER